MSICSLSITIHVHPQFIHSLSILCIQIFDYSTAHKIDHLLGGRSALARRSPIPYPIDGMICLNRNMGSISVLEPGILDVDTVKEGTEILLLDDGGLADAGADLGDLLEVDALDGDVVLFLLLLGDEDSLGGVNALVDLESQEVLDFESLSGKMGTLPPSMTLTTIGKWANASTMRNLQPTVTPVIMFLILLRMVPRVAFLFFFCSHMRSFTPSLPVFLRFSFLISKGTCLKDLVILPRGPVTVTFLDLMSTFTPSGMGSYCSETMYFMIPVWLQLNQYSIFNPLYPIHPISFSPFPALCSSPLHISSPPLPRSPPSFHQSLQFKELMRAHRKKVDKKNIFDEDQQEEQAPSSAQPAGRTQSKPEKVQELYDAAKIEQNEMYINKKAKGEEDHEHESPSKPNTSPAKKKKTAKKKKLFESSDEHSSGERSDTNPQEPNIMDRREQPAEDSPQEQPQRPEQAVHFKNSSEKQSSEEENQQYIAKVEEVKDKMKKQPAKVLQEDEEPGNFAELLERAGGDRNEMRMLLTDPIPKGYKATCVFKRVPSGFSETYQLHTYEQAIMFCENQRGSIGANYYISMTKQMDKKSSAYIGKLRGNAAGSCYHLYDAGEQPGKNKNRKQWRITYAKIEYETNFMGMNGPRKLKAAIPSVSQDMDPDIFKLSEEEDIFKFKAPNVIFFRNKQPRWNQRLKSYALNFGGRVKQASIKNFILVDDETTEQEEFTAQNALVFGKIDDHSFSLEAVWPLSIYQAFGIVISEFDFKLNCQ